MIDLNQIAQITPEQLENMSKDQLLSIKVGMSLLSIQTKTSFLHVALESGHFTHEDVAAVLTVDKVLTEMLQKFYPKGGWR